MNTLEESVLELALENDKRLQEYDIELVRKCMYRYFEIRREFDTRRVIAEDMDPYQIFVDVMHSSLLHRLLKDEPIFPFPPPRQFSYPWYSLLENKADVCSIFLHPTEPKISINQCSWDLEDTISKDEYIVSYEGRYAARLTHNKAVTQDRNDWNIALIPLSYIGLQNT